MVCVSPCILALVFACCEFLTQIQAGLDLVLDLKFDAWRIANCKLESLPLDDRLTF